MSDAGTATPSVVRPRPDGAAAGSAVRGPAVPGGSAAGVTTAVVLATTPAAEGGPAAGQDFAGTTIVRRLVDQLTGLGMRAVHVVTRPGWEPALQASLQGVGLSVALRPSADPAEDLRAVAEAARATSGGLVVAQGEIVTHREALAGLLANPRIATGMLAAGGYFGWPFVPRARSNRGRVVSVASPYHAVEGPNITFLGVLKVASADRAALVEVAERLATLTAPPLPPAWEQELDVKAELWRLALAKAALEGAGDESGDPQDVELSADDEARVRRQLAVAPHDMASLLAVGVVRSGIHLGSSYVRKLFWARPLSGAAVAQAAREIIQYDEDRVLLESAVKATDGFFTTFFVSPYSKFLARWAARRGWTPNQVTTVSLAIGLLAAAAFATGQREGLIVGALLLQLSFTTDCVDGQLARYTRTFSKLGGWLDSVFDRTKEYAVFAGLAVGAGGLGQDVWVLAAAALTLQTVRHTFDFSFAAGQQQVIAAAPQPPIERPGDRPTGRGDAPRRPAAAGSRPAAAPAARSLPSRMLGVWRLLDRWPGLRWVKRIVAFPIGERFAAISITAAVATPRTTFVVLLAWGGIAACYTLTGRLLRSLAP